MPLDGDPITVSDGPKVFDLLELTADNPLLAVDARIPVGRYKQIRLILSNENTVVVNGVSKPLKVPSGEQTGVKLDGAFEISGVFLNMTLDFNSDESVYYTQGQGWKLKPVIEIESTSIVSGPFNVSGLIADETVVTNLQPDGSFKMLSTYDPRVEIRGWYFYNMETKLLHLEPNEIICLTCSILTNLPFSIFNNVPPTDINIATWTDVLISGTIDSENSLIPIPVRFDKTDSFSIDTSTGYTNLKVKVNYPDEDFYNDKVGIMVFVPESGKSFIDLKMISSNNAEFEFMINYKYLPGGVPGGEKQYMIKLYIANNLDYLSIDSKANWFFTGDSNSANLEYLLTVPVSDKVLESNINYLP